MPLLVTDPDLEQRLIAQRKASGGDRFDEVWEDTYVMAPLADNEHQDIQGRLTSAFLQAVGGDPQVKVLPGANISDREQGWEHNYRCPDVAVFLRGTSARNCETHWLGGPDFAVEILSRGDRTPQKLAFYASVNVRELLVIDREPWSLELFQLDGGELRSAGIVTTSGDPPLISGVLPLSLRLVVGARPLIEISHHQNEQQWLI